MQTGVKLTKTGGISNFLEADPISPNHFTAQLSYKGPAHSHPELAWGRGHHLAFAAGEKQDHRVQQRLLLHLEC